MNKLIKIVFSICIICLASLAANAQCDTIATVCQNNFSKDQTAEFHLTLYGGSVYRFGGCSGLENGNLIFRLYDEERNELFSNAEQQMAPYWDFKVNSTLDIIVEANLNLEKISSGCAVLLVGFKP